MESCGVSVIIAAFNGRAHLGAALASVRLQSHQPDEVIVVDAGSVDGTADLLDEIAEQYPRLRGIKGLGRLTAPQARNVALQEVTSPFVATLDQDDVMAGHRLAQQATGLAGAPHLTALGGRLLKVDTVGVARPPSAANNRYPHGRPTTPERIRWATIRYSPALSSGLIYRTQGLRALGGFDEAHPLIDDYALLERLAERAAVAMTDTVVGRYRTHEHMTSVVDSQRQLAQTRLLQWRLIHERLGIQPGLAAVAALARPEQSPTTDALTEACDLLAALYDEACARIGADDADRAWLQADYHLHRQRLVSRIDELAAAATSP